MQETDPKPATSEGPLVVGEFSQRFRPLDPATFDFLRALKTMCDFYWDLESGDQSFFWRLSLFGSASTILYVLDLAAEEEDMPYFEIYWKHTWAHVGGYQETADYHKIPFILCAEREARIPAWCCDILVLEPRGKPELCARAVSDLARARAAGDDVTPESVRVARRAAVEMKLSAVPPRIDWLVLKYYYDFPEEIDSIPPESFERLVAELLAGVGFDVTITPHTHDGGRDIIACPKSALSPERILVECKQSRLGRTVGVDVVRALYGVATDENVSRAILVAATRFSRQALEFIERNEFRIDAVDRKGLLRWMKQYFDFARQAREQERLSRFARW